MKVKPLSPVAVAAARRLLERADVQHPRDIHVEAIAAREGAMVLHGPLATARGHIVRTDRRAIIRVGHATSSMTALTRSTIAHELGHLVLHGLDDHFAQCESAMVPRTGRMWAVEREANDFSAELLLPEAFVSAYCASLRPGFEEIERIARVFKTSLEMSAIRFVEIAAAPCAAVLAVDGRIRWAPESLSFPGKIVQRRAVDAGSASALVAAGAYAGVAREVPGEAWGGKGTFVETAVRLGFPGHVLSWIVPA